jgi:transcriptional regulator with GAF, ATPase, and Fis domain
VRRHEGGEGETAVVRERDGRLLLLKVLADGFELREPALLASLRHPRIPRVLETGRDAGGRAWLLREYLAGEPVRGPLAPEQAVELCCQLLEILAFVHRRGILHLDVKPANVLREAGDGAPRYALLDFGLASRDGHARGGTARYAAPERLHGLPADRTSDLYSLGVLLRELLGPAGDDPARLPPPLDSVLEKLLAATRERRFADAEEALEALAGRGRPSLGLLRLDVAQLFPRLRRQLAAIPSGADVGLRGGEAEDRADLALSVLAALPDARAVRATAGETVIERGGRDLCRLELPAIDEALVAAHLATCVGLDPAAAAAAAAALWGAGHRTPGRVGSALQGLVEAGRIVPDGTRWTWPEAAAGRPDLSPPAAEAATPEARARACLRRGEPARALALAGDEPGIRARALLDLGRVAQARDAASGVDDPRLHASLSFAAGDLARAEQLARSLPGSAADLALLGLVLVQRGADDEAERVLHRALDASDEDLDQNEHATIHCSLGLLARRRGDLQRALRHQQQALARFRRLGHVQGAATTTLNLGVLHKDLGRLDEAREHHRAARGLYRWLHDPRGEALAEANLGAVALAAGDPAQAERRLRAARTRLLRLGAGDSLPRLDELLREAEAAPRAGSGDDSQPMSDPGAVPQEVFRTFLAINRRLAGEGELAQAMRYLLDSAVTLTGARHGYLLLSKDGGLRLELQSGQGAHAFSRSLVHRALQLRRTLSAADAVADRQLAEMQSVQDLQARSALCVPFQSAAGVTGALYVEHSGQVAAFGARERQWLEILADQAAIAVDRMERERRLQQDLEHSQRDLLVARHAQSRQRGPRQLLGRSRPMRELAQQIDRLAQSSLPILIRGETGTGKELVARAIHERSPRGNGPFVSENCSAIAPGLIESELFGHVRGAFTGADQDRPGLLELSSTGTLFLDEVGDMPLELQARLLRALQEGVVRRVGGQQTIPFDCRLLAATHKDLKALIGQGQFREDLYFRIAAAELVVPPLRERGDDVELLAEEFLARHNREHHKAVRLPPAARSLLREHGWPGNVRELEHAIARAWLLTDGDELALDLVPHRPGTAAAGGPAAAEWPALPLREAEKRTIDAALRATGGDKSAAARLLGISRTALYEKLRRTSG